MQQKLRVFCAEDDMNRGNAWFEQRAHEGCSDLDTVSVSADDRNVLLTNGLHVAHSIGSESVFTKKKPELEMMHSLFQTLFGLF